MKKIIPLLIVGILVLGGFVSSAYTNDNKLNNLQIKRNCESEILANGDELDQYQLEMEDYYVYIGKTPDRPYHYYIGAQEFIPTKNILNRVELLVSKDVYTTYDLTVAIRDDLSGSDLTSINKNSESIPTEEFTWIEFDFDDINVIPGSIYYIVCYTYDSPNNRYEWGVTIDNLYPNGSIHWSEDGEEWYFDTEVDATFKTYGWNNNPPYSSGITGPDVGKPGIEYTFCINVSDSDNDDLYVLWEWGDGTFSEWSGPHESGTEVCDSHIWNETGTYTITVRIQDSYGLFGPETTFTFKCSRNKAISSSPLLKFLERYPPLNLLLQILKIH
jgi:hypothetical protein